jgi:hypothetical protein
LQRLVLVLVAVALDDDMLFVKKDETTTATQASTPASKKSDDSRDIFMQATAAAAAVGIDLGTFTFASSSNKTKRQPGAVEKLNLDAAVAALSSKSIHSDTSSSQLALQYVGATGENDVITASRCG